MRGRGCRRLAAAKAQAEEADEASPGAHRRRGRARRGGRAGRSSTRTADRSPHQRPRPSISPRPEAARAAEAAGSPAPRRAAAQAAAAAAAGRAGRRPSSVLPRPVARALPGSSPWPSGCTTSTWPRVRATRDRLISEGQAHHDELVATAQSARRAASSAASGARARRTTSCSPPRQKRHDELIAEATPSTTRCSPRPASSPPAWSPRPSSRRRRSSRSSASERGLLERKIAELRGFERNYRARLKSYIEGQLHDLDRAGGDHERRPRAAQTASRADTERLDQHGRRAPGHAAGRCLVAGRARTFGARCAFRR